MSTTNDTAKAAGKIECQVCAGFYAKTAKGLVHNHGYKRPGDGFLHGECFGARRAPYTATDALHEAVTAYEAEAERLAGKRAKLAARTLTSFTTTYYYTFGRAAGKVREREQYAVGVTSLNTMENVYRAKLSSVESEISAVAKALASFKARIAAAAK